MPCSVCGDDICRCSTVEPAPADSAPWREEVAARLNRYQARRKPRPPRYPSLRLPFEQDVERPADRPDTVRPAVATISHHALALDPFAEPAVDRVPQSSPPALRISMAPEPQPATADPASEASLSQPQTARIIEFPRSWTPEPRPADELAEPVIERPRILEVPEFVPPPPALGGITIETPTRPQAEKRLGIDLPLQNAAMGRRVLAAVLDGLIVAGACALFGFVFWKLTAVQPPRLQIAEVFAGLLTLFWAAYQYLLIVYSGATPGLRLARLELARFDGSRAGRKLRRWRVLASFLSAASLGMGYAWVFLDEDALCWHDRITRTYLAPRAVAPDPANSPV